jgi:hypothetical protein
MFPEIPRVCCPKGKLFKGENLISHSPTFMGKPTLWAFSLLGGILLALFGQEASAQEKELVPGPSVSPYQEPEKLSPRSAAGVGVLEITRPDGNKDKIYYSTITPEEELQRNEEEKEKSNRSWEMLKNVILDKRKK